MHLYLPPHFLPGYSYMGLDITNLTKFLNNVGISLQPELLPKCKYLYNFIFIWGWIKLHVMIAKISSSLDQQLKRLAFLIMWHILNWNEPDLKGNETTVYDFHLGFLNFLHDSWTFNSRFSQRSLDTRCLVEVIASFPSNWLNTAVLLTERTVSVLELFFQTSLTNFNLFLGVPVFLWLVVSTVLSS